MMTLKNIPDQVVGPLTQTDLVKYQGASGDFNAIHHDPVGAAARGQRVISPGMFQAGLMDTWLAEATEGAAVARLAVRFLAPACVGDTLTITGGLADDGSGEIEIRCMNGEGVVLVSGRATLAS